MKIVIKEITVNGDDLLVYQMSETNQPINCVVTTKDKLSKFINPSATSITNYTYQQYIEQDEITK